MRLCPLILIVFLPHVASAQSKLEWKFEPGDVFFTERVYAQKQVIEVKNKQFKQESSNTWITRVTVKEKVVQGHVLEFKIESVTYKTSGPAVAGGFDDKMAAKMKGAVFSAVVTPAGRIAKFHGYDEFLQRLSEKNAEVEKVLKVLLSEETIKEGLEETLGFLPEKPVARNDRWKRESVEQAPPFGSFKTVFEYVLEDEKDGAHMIACAIKMTYAKPAADHELFRVVKGGLSAEDGKAQYVFDNDKGRLVRGEKSIHLKGDILLEAMGNETPMVFTSENTLKIRVFEKEEK
ncbi:MAG: DUF6263 family protein [Gemmataceae bacterium]|nr:DUF6263 family protein [Gemmataceae bacterium]MCI0737744.1 DUF6263 family protein [Gemmataceae bacterium]